MEKNYLILFLLLLSSCAILVVGQRYGDVRLAGFESSKLMGRLEMFINGSWFGICNDGFGFKELAVACRQLGLGNGVGVYNRDMDAVNKTHEGAPGRTDPVIVRFGGATIALEVSCNGTENHLLNCLFYALHDCINTEAVAVQCSEYRPQPYSGQVRLVGGDYPSEGIVQVYFNGEWGIVCDPGFNDTSALVVCRQLGYSDGSASIGATSYGSPFGPVWVTSLSCVGSESCLSSCLLSAPCSRRNCSGNVFATVTCGSGGAQIDNQLRECEVYSTPGEGSLRLVDVRGVPHSGTNGTLQVYMNGQWGGFCGLTYKYNWESLEVMCRQLGYRTWNSRSTDYRMISEGTMHITDIHCTGNEDNVFGCQYGNTSISRCGNTYLFITCHPDMFYVPMYGSVTLSGVADGAGLVFVGGRKGFHPICDEDFDLVDGRVACRQMGYEGVNAVPKGSYYDATGASPAVTHITCEGSESHLLSCNHQQDSTQLCCADSLAGIHCATNASDMNRGSLRLIGGNSSRGVLEISLDGRWWVVCSSVFSTAAANVACRQLGFYSGEVGFTSGGNQDSEIADIFTVVRCKGSEQRLYDCSYVTLPRTACPGVNLTCSAPSLTPTSSPSGSVDVCSPSKGEMCSSVCGIRSQILSYPLTSGNCSISESCTYLSCALIVVSRTFSVPYSLNITLLPCSDPYGVYVHGESVLLQVVIDDIFTESKNFTLSVLGSKAEVIVDITQQCYGLTLSVRVFILDYWVEFITPSDIYMLCTSSPAEKFCFKNHTYYASESDRNASFVVIRSGAAITRSCIGYNIMNISTQDNKCCFKAGKRETRCEIELVHSFSELAEALFIELTPSSGKSVCDFPGNISAIKIIHSSGVTASTKTIENNGTVLITTIIAGIVAVIAVSTVMVCLLLLCVRKRRGPLKEKATARMQVEHTINSTMEINFTLEADEWEMKHSDLEIQGHLGKGQFGNVVLAFLKSTSCTSRVKNYIDRMVMQGDSLSTSKTVAVKYLKDSQGSKENMNVFLKEIELMKKVSTTGNNHIVQIIGCILSEPPIAMVMEYVPFGDLRSNLVQWKEQFKTGIASVDHADYSYSREPLEESDLWSFAHQIAIGMRFLASLNVVHRDLACRNVLVGNGKLLKISDFGLSKEIDGLYASSTNTRLPIRWMSPEAITHRLFSEKSDVWSYGVCLWEICTMGEVPYGCLSNLEVAKTIVAMVLLDRPRTCSDEIYDLMLNCWKMESNERPTFDEIKEYLEGLIEDRLPNAYYLALPVDPLLEGNPTATTTLEDTIRSDHEMTGDEDQDTLGLELIFSEADY